jgi:hypothetical protein
MTISTTISADAAEARLSLVQKIQQLEQEAHGSGLLVTARALNQAKNAWGWEVAGNILAAGKAARGERQNKAR